jgi:hypothetical protein
MQKAGHKAHVLVRVRTRMGQGAARCGGGKKQGNKSFQAGMHGQFLRGLKFRAREKQSNNRLVYGD